MEEFCEWMKRLKQIPWIQIEANYSTIHRRKTLFNILALRYSRFPRLCGWVDVPSPPVPPPPQPKCSSMVNSSTRKPRIGWIYTIRPPMRWSLGCPNVPAMKCELLSNPIRRLSVPGTKLQSYRDNRSCSNYRHSSKRIWMNCRRSSPGNRGKHWQMRPVMFYVVYVSSSGH